MVIRSMPPLLLTADLHFTPKYFEWLAAHALEFQCIAIAGDLCDMFLDSNAPLSDELIAERGRTRETSSNVSVADQRNRIEEWLGRIARTTPVVFCSGNHDAGVWRPKNPGVSGDLSIFESADFILVTCPWLAPVSGEIAQVALYILQVLKTAHALSLSSKKPLLIINHVPPSSADGNAIRISHAIRQFKPAIVGCGHEHQSPYFAGPLVYSFKVPILNPGNPEVDAGEQFPAPNHFLLFPQDSRNNCRVDWNHLAMAPDGVFAWHTTTDAVSMQLMKG